MSLVIAFAYVVFGLLFLAKGGDKLVEAATSIAKRFHVPEVFIGVVLVGFGTSLPEIITIINAALKGQDSLALGTLVGSNIANIILIFAVGLILCRPMPAHQLLSEKVNYFLMLAGSVLFGLMVWQFNVLSSTIGVVLLASLVFCLLVSMKFSTHHPNNDDDEVLSTPGILIWGGLGFVGLFLGADLLINGAVTIAKYFNVKEHLIGLTLVALGTSLPELFATFAAAKKNRIGLVAGNVLGSNLFNLLGAAGIGALFMPLDASPIMADILFMLGVSLLIIPVFFAPKMPWRIFGVFLLVIYVAYITHLGTAV